MRPWLSQQWNSQQGFVGVPNLAPPYPARQANPGIIPIALGGGLLLAGGGYLACRPRVLEEESAIALYQDDIREARAVVKDAGCFQRGAPPFDNRYQVLVYVDDNAVEELSRSFETKKAAQDYFAANTKDKDKAERQSNPVWPWLVGAAVVAAGGAAYAYCRSRVVLRETIEAKDGTAGFDVSRTITHNGCFADKKYTVEAKFGKVTYTESFDDLDEATAWGAGGVTPDGAEPEDTGDTPTGTDWEGAASVGDKLVVGRDEDGVGELPISIKFTDGEVGAEWMRNKLPTSVKNTPFLIKPFDGQEIAVGELSIDKGVYFYAPLVKGRHRLLLGEAEGFVDVTEKASNPTECFPDSSGTGRCRCTPWACACGANIDAFLNGKKTRKALPAARAAKHKALASAPPRFTGNPCDVEAYKRLRDFNRMRHEQGLPAAIIPADYHLRECSKSVVDRALVRPSGPSRAEVVALVQRAGKDVEQFQGQARVWAQEAQNDIERSFNDGWNDAARGMYRPRGLREYYDAGAASGSQTWRALGW